MNHPVLTKKHTITNELCKRRRHWRNRHLNYNAEADGFWHELLIRFCPAYRFLIMDMINLFDLLWEKDSKLSDCEDQIETLSDGNRHLMLKAKEYKRILREHDLLNKIDSNRLL
jgi:hypothetical protein